MDAMIRESLAERRRRTRAKFGGPFKRDPKLEALLHLAESDPAAYATAPAGDRYRAHFYRLAKAEAEAGA